MRPRPARPSPPRLYVILDHGTVGDDEGWLAVVGDVADALDGREEGMLQLRVKSRSGAERLRLLERGVARVRPRDVTVLANGSLVEARRVGAHGAHWPETMIPEGPGFEETPASPGGAAAGADGDGMLRAASAHSIAATRRARAAGADFAVFGPVFEPGSKSGEPRGLQELARVAAATRLPVVALGGIDARRAASCLSRGARGVAVVSAVVCRPDPGVAALELLDTVRAGGSR